MSHDQRQKALFNAIGKLLKPLVRVLLRNGIPYAAFADVAKHVYVDVAAQEFNLPGRKQTNSRIATITDALHFFTRQTGDSGDAGIGLFAPGKIKLLRGNVDVHVFGHIRERGIGNPVAQQQAHQGPQ